MGEVKKFQEGTRTPPLLSTFRAYGYRTLAVFKISVEYVGVTIKAQAHKVYH